MGQTQCSHLHPPLPYHQNLHTYRFPRWPLTLRFKSTSLMLKGQCQPPWICMPDSLSLSYPLYLKPFSFPPGITVYRKPCLITLRTVSQLLEWQKLSPQAHMASSPPSLYSWESICSPKQTSAVRITCLPQHPYMWINLFLIVGARIQKVVPGNRQGHGWEYRKTFFFSFLFPLSTDLYFPIAVLTLKCQKKKAFLPRRMPDRSSLCFTTTILNKENINALKHSHAFQD